MNEHINKKKAFCPILLLLLIAFHQSDAIANNTFIDYTTIGAAFPTPTNYMDYDFGTGGYINVGKMTDIGLVELSYFDTATPADSDYATNIEQERVLGSGPTKYYSRAITGLWGMMIKDPTYLFKLGVGFSYRDYRIVRPGIEVKDKNWGLSYAFGIGMSVYKNNYIVLEYYSIDHLIETGNLGLQISF